MEERKSLWAEYIDKKVPWKWGSYGTARSNHAAGYAAELSALEK